MGRGSPRDRRAALRQLRAVEVATALDSIKNLCYRFASQSGLTVSIDDVKTPKIKRAMLDDYEAQADKIENQFRRGIITDGERRQQEVRIWTEATGKLQDIMEQEFRAQFNPIGFSGLPAGVRRHGGPPSRAA